MDKPTLPKSRSKDIQKKQLGNIAMIVLAIINVVVWLSFPPADNGDPHFSSQMIAEILSSTAMILMACTLFLAARPRFLEPYFGGLDQMYQSKKKAAIASIVLIFFHFFIVANTRQPNVGAVLGIIAFAGVMILALITLAPRIPFIGGNIHLAYDQWRRLHRWMGVFYIIAIAHSLLVPSLVQTTLLPSLYLRIINLFGVGAYLYKELFVQFFAKPYHYVVESVRQLNGSAVEITLKPRGQKPAFNAGQFIFIRFDEDKVLAESHPFTISSSPQEENIRLSIKVSGDWTQYLFNNLRAGAKALVDGGYGMFNYRTGGKQQIWIAGGIGVTPFLSWIRDLNRGLDCDIDFYYSVRGETDALFWDEFVTAHQKHEHFRATITYSSRDGKLTAKQITALTPGNIADKEIYMCGPIGMMDGFQKQFKQMGIPASHIHFEEFNFR